ncbi:MAG: DUF1223 domain-containing protein [Hyphomonadaceae bacterium]
MTGIRSKRSVCAVFASALVASIAASAAFAKDAKPTQPASASPTVVELFQSQGCSSCPPANENILTLTNRPDLLVLSFGVTYWDRLGWKDTFASKENTQRQYDYANGGLHRRNVATPQVVINGHVDIVGNRRDELIRAVDGARLSASAPAITLSGNTLTVAAASSAGAADVWLVRYDPRTVQVPIQAGENGGRTLPHHNVVHEIVRLGGWSGKAASYQLPASTDANYRTAILVQDASGGPIIASFKS